MAYCRRFARIVEAQRRQDDRGPGRRDVRGAAKTLLLLFVISFLPFGAWSLVANNLVHWFGIAQFGYVLSAYLQNPTWMRDP
jgi:hypothetical protein